MPTHVYLSPGMFGFGDLASFSYFEHVKEALGARFSSRGRACSIHVCDVHPTASIRRRAVRLARTICETSGDGHEPIHIVGHSTGGLDARLVASPSIRLTGLSENDLAWVSRLRSVTSMNTPHYGTPLAAFFATVSGQRVLYATTALTVIGLKLGAPPIAAASALLAALGRVSGAIELEVIERATESVIRLLDDAASRDVRQFLRLIRDDQGAIVQLMPEAMDLFQTSVEDRASVRYQSVASFAPGAKATLMNSIFSPWGVVSAGIFNALQTITARHDPRYPCNAGDSDVRKKVLALLGELPAETANDGVVPLYSQIWGDLIWIGRADHLDIVGHFPGETARRKSASEHHDWLRSGAKFDRIRFDTVMDRVFAGMLLGEDLLAAA